MVGDPRQGPRALNGAGTGIDSPASRAGRRLRQSSAAHERSTAAVPRAPAPRAPSSGKSMSTTIRSPGSEPLRRFLGPLALVRDLWSHRGLIGRMAAREFDSRYKGSALGMLWSFLQPLVMLAVYTYVFSVVFRARWSTGEADRTGFALALFAGLIVFNLFSECVVRAPAAIVS